MTTFIAHYRSPNASNDLAKGMFEFESESRLGSKANKQDARLRMLELYGQEAIAWTVTEIEHKRSGRDDICTDGQLELDFRMPKEKHRRASSTKRGML